MDLPGDDRLDRRRSAFLEAARTLFVDLGYERTTLADVVERAGGSLATLYKLFGSKEGLLTAVVTEVADSGESIIAEVAASALGPAEALRSIGRRLHEKFLDPESMAMIRIVIARSIEDEAFAHGFYEATIVRTQRSLTELFESWRASGVAFNGTPQSLASLFMGLVLYDLQSQAIRHGVVEHLTCEQLGERMAFFLRGAGLA